MIVPFYYINDIWCFLEVTFKRGQYYIEWNTYVNCTISEIINRLYNGESELLVLTLDKDKNKYENKYCYYHAGDQRYHEFDPDLMIVLEIDDTCYEFDDYHEFLRCMSELYKHYNCIEVETEKSE